MSNESNKPNGQEQPEDTTQSHQLIEPSCGAIERGDLCGQSSASPQKEGVPNQGLSDRDQTDSGLNPQPSDPIRQATSETANELEQSYSPTGQDGQTLGASVSVNDAEEQPEDEPEPQIDPGTQLTEADQSTHSELADIESPAQEQVLDGSALSSCEKSFGKGNVRDLEDEKFDPQPSPKVTAELTNGLEQSDAALAGQDEEIQGTSTSDARPDEQLNDDPVRQIVPGSPINEASQFTQTELVDVEPSAVEKILDNLALLSYDETLGRGNVRDLEPEEIDFQPSPTHDLVRRGKHIYLCVVKWSGSKPRLTILEYGFTRNGKDYDVPALPSALYESLLLPTDVVRHYASQDVFDSIFALLQHTSVLSEEQCELLTFWSMASWFADVLPFIPRLTITGSKYAADLLFRGLRCACRRPVLLSGMSSAVLKSIPISELMPSCFILATNPSNRASALLEASDQKGYLVASGGQMQQCYCVKCVYLGEEPRKSVPEGIHIHLAPNASLPVRPLPSDLSVQALQNQLLSYRTFNLDRIRASEFTANDLLPEFDAVARALGAAIVDDSFLQERVVQLLRESNEQARVDRSSGLKGLVLRAVLFHCHQNDQQQVFAREIADTVNRLYSEEGESLKVSSETVGHVLKSLGLYSCRLGNGGRGLRLDKSTQSKAHELCHAYDVLPAAPACGYCHKVQIQQTEEVM